MYTSNALGTTNTTNTSTTVENPKGKLGKDDFLKLFLTELQYQDPTEPMDNEKILTQTSQLATLESQDDLKNTLSEIVSGFSSNAQFNATSMIGRAVSVGDSSINLTKGSNINFGTYLPDGASGLTVSILNKDGTEVYKNQLADATAGFIAMNWDGKDKSGNSVDSGDYKINITYTNSENKTVVGNLASAVESVRFNGTNAELKVGGKYISLADIKEIYQ